MLEMFINPKRAQRRPWEMFFIGLIYATLSIFIANWIFMGDPVLNKHMGIWIVTFCVMFSVPFVYYTLKMEEEKDILYSGGLRLLREHSKAIFVLMWLFIGFIIAFSFWYIVLPTGPHNFYTQIEVFCQINNPSDIQGCVDQFLEKQSNVVTGAVTAGDRMVAIFVNNIYVLVFTLIFSIIFGAGAVFVLAWNASVISAAIGLFSESSIHRLPTGFFRYMIHGFPEISAYFVGALAGGILSVAVIKHDIHNERFWAILQDSLNLILIAIGILFFSALIEVFITPALF